MFKIFKTRLPWFLLLISLQLLFAFVLVTVLSLSSPLVSGCLWLLSLLVVLQVVSRPENPAYKIAWLAAIFLFPVFGGLFYLLWGRRRTTPKQRKVLRSLQELPQHKAPQSQAILDCLHSRDPHLARIAHYAHNTSGYPLYGNTRATYHPLGQDFFRDLKRCLSQAEKFIFMEYFIVEDGVMWQEIFELLKEKASKGVEVLFLYDDLGSIQVLPKHFRETLEQHGIRCAAFGPFRPTLNVAMNYRDHRKICVVDGKYGFCGGANLADEYINAVEKHGHWKDTSVLLEGDAVWSLSLLFLSLWQYTTGDAVDYDRYRTGHSVPSEGLVQPFGDIPLDNLDVGENLYLQVIGRAKDYIYITTPYLVLDNEMTTALIVAAQSGVDVRILTPHIPDKKLVFALTRANYPRLVEAGVKIFEYTPGFLHAKMLVSDDQVAMVGTTNMDYRSFYLHFECGVLFYHHPTVEAVKADILSTLTICQEAPIKHPGRPPRYRGILEMVLRLLAPLI